MKKLPYGINDYEKLVEGDYYYVDKTKYIEELENWGVYVRYVRPKSFGKTLFLYNRKVISSKKQEKKSNK